MKKYSIVKSDLNSYVSLNAGILSFSATDDYIISFSLNSKHFKLNLKNILIENINIGSADYGFVGIMLDEKLNPSLYFSEVLYIVADSFPSDPILNQIVYNTKRDSSYIWDGTRWKSVAITFIADIGFSILTEFLSDTSLIEDDSLYSIGFPVFSTDNTPFKINHPHSFDQILTDEDDLLISLESHQILSNVVEFSTTCGENINKYSCVKIENGMVFVKNAKSSADCDGIALFSAKRGNTIKIIKHGIIKDSSFNFDPNKYLYCGYDGEITDVPTSVFSISKIGISLSDDMILINIKETKDIT
jgi:hypothetical protein